MALNPVTPTTPVTTASPARGWATSTVWAGALWILFAIAPIPGTTLLGLPLSLYVMAGGLVTALWGRFHGDRVAARRGWWGLGLGCFGYVFLIAFFTIAGGVLVAGLIAAIRAAGNHRP